MLETSTRPARALTAQDISARIERLPITRKLSLIRVIIGAATFFDAYTVLAIAFAMPVLSREWQLTPSQIGMILSCGYLGQMVGAVFFRLVGRAYRAPASALADDHRVCRDGHRLPVCLERLVHEPVPLHPGDRHRRRNSSCERLHQ